jgi:hypothetical protein
MDSFRKGASPQSQSTGGQRAGEGSTDAPLPIFNYPSLGELFEGSDAKALEEMRTRLSTTGQNLERVVRNGTKDEAERAARAARAVSVTIQFLNDLEQMRRDGGAKQP